VGVVVFAQRRDDAAKCDRSRTQLFSAGLKHQAPDTLVRAVVDSCREPEDVAVAAAGVIASGRPGAGATMARAAVARGPHEYAAWAALSRALKTSDPAGSARAARHAEALNPRWRAPAAAGP
jgi:hypothetical protein